jgi:hypothetical protein
MATRKKADTTEASTKPELTEAEIAARKEEQTKARKAYGDAIARLRETHRDDFDRFLAEEQERQGIEVKRRRSPAEIEAAKAEHAAEMERRKAEREAARAAKEQAKIDEAIAKQEAKLEALRAKSTKGQIDSLAAALEFVTTADLEPVEV